MSLINCKIYLALNWTKSFVMSDNKDDDDDDTTFNLTKAKLYVPMLLYQRNTM